LLDYPQQDTSQQLPSHLSVLQWSISQHTTSFVQSVLDSQQTISVDAEQLNNPNVKITNKFFMINYLFIV